MRTVFGFQARDAFIALCVLTLFYAGLFKVYVDRVQSYHEQQVQSLEGNPLDLIRGGVKLIRCHTTKGDFDILLNPAQSPNSVSELVNMVRAGFFSDIAFFRVNQYIVQFGIRDKSFKYQSQWQRDLNHLPKDQRRPWKRGVMAMIGGTQMLIVKTANEYMGLNNHDTVVGTISEDDMSVIDRLYAYNDVIDNPTGSHGPSQGEIYEKGWRYLNENFPLVDKITGCVLV